MKWILVADAAKARIFSTVKLGDKWTAVNELDHPESRQKISELYRDSPNVMSSSANAGKDVIEPATDLKEKEVEAFAREVSDFLEENHHNNVFDQLYVIAAPSFLGTLRPMLHKGVEGKIVESINKNITDLPVDELQERLQQSLDA